MQFYVAYRQEKRLITQFVTISNNRANGLLGENGNVVQAYVDRLIANIGTNQSFYTIETEGRSLCGYFTLALQDGICVLQYKQFRPQYSEFLLQFDTMIENFRLTGDWQYDVLGMTDISNA